MDDVQKSTSKARYSAHQVLPKYQYPMTSLAREKGMTKVATKISAEAKETKNRFWGARSARLVNTATTTRAFPTIVNKMMTATTMMIRMAIHWECGGGLNVLVSFASPDALEVLKLRCTKSITRVFLSPWRLAILTVVNSRQTVFVEMQKPLTCKHPLSEISRLLSEVIASACFPFGCERTQTSEKGSTLLPTC